MTTNKNSKVILAGLLMVPITSFAQTDIFQQVTGYSAASLRYVILMIIMVLITTFYFYSKHGLIKALKNDGRSGNIINQEITKLKRKMVLLTVLIVAVGELPLLMSS